MRLCAHGTDGLAQKASVREQNNSKTGVSFRDPQKEEEEDVQHPIRIGVLLNNFFSSSAPNGFWTSSTDKLDRTVQLLFYEGKHTQTIVVG
jgi:hypothetical protein